jgi:AraC family transcriptional regulator
MTQIAPPRFEDGPARLMGGVRRHHAMADAARDIPEQWGELVATGALDNAKGDTAYGIVCQTDPDRGTFEYMAAVEVDDLEAWPADARLKLPAARYAVFTHPGPGSTLKDTFGYIWNDWLPTSGFKPAPTPNFERYGPGYDPATNSGDIEVWIAVEPAA